MRQNGLAGGSSTLNNKYSTTTLKIVSYKDGNILVVNIDLLPFNPENGNISFPEGYSFNVLVLTATPNQQELSNSTTVSGTFEVVKKKFDNVPSSLLLLKDGIKLDFGITNEPEQDLNIRCSVVFF